MISEDCIVTWPRAQFQFGREVQNYNTEVACGRLECQELVNCLPEEVDFILCTHAHICYAYNLDTNQ